MSCYFDTFEFKFAWRSYQDEILKSFDNHISDNHFHIIAPPGSGKTILGIEIFKRLQKRTLVLAPTLAIRNQWKQRVDDFFLQNKTQDYFSFDVKKPSDVTFITYQSLFAFYNTFSNLEDYVDFFKKHEIETLVLDEAHHLKNAWWKALIYLKNSSSFFVVALTATPPYDSGNAELSKYFELCGEIDDEIAVPSLVKETDLCPHQDFVYFSKPDDLEIYNIAEFRTKIAQFTDQLLQDSNLINLLKTHRFYKNPEHYFDEIYSDTKYFSAILIFLNASGIPIEPQKMEVLGFDKNEFIEFPKLNLEWIEILLQSLIVEDRLQLNAHENYLHNLEKQLRKLNVYEKKRVNFVGNDVLYKSLTASSSKLKSVVDVVDFEYENLKEKLSCVILTDYIRKEFLDINTDNVSSIKKIGAVPIFKHLQRSFKYKNGLALLTGSIVIIHKSILPFINQENFTFSALKAHDDFIMLNAKSASVKSTVSLITELFERGIIKVLIGTKSLLGEGWDAPSINTLILLSSVGSFVSSNQMRGRAIRKNPKEINKTANIWHFVSLDVTDAFGGKDAEILKRRFDAFVGVSNTTNPFIETGYDRLQIPEYLDAQNIDLINHDTLKRAKDRALIKSNWENAILKGGELVKQTHFFYQGNNSFKKQQQIYFFDAVRFFVVELSVVIITFYFEFFLQSLDMLYSKGLVYLLYIFSGAFIIKFGRNLYKALKLYIQHGFLDKKIKKMGLSIVDTMIELGLVTSEKSGLMVESYRYGNGDVVCDLKGASLLENTIFSDALTQLLAPIESPRYLVVKTSSFKRTLNIENFYAVPDIFGDKKSKALVFEKHWIKHIGKSKLIYTRTLNGRKKLLKARLFHVHNAFKETSKKVIAWR